MMQADKPNVDTHLGETLLCVLEYGCMFLFVCRLLGKFLLVDTASLDKLLEL